MSEIKGTLSAEELVRIIQMAGENGDIDGKGPVSWDGAAESAKLAKDIAAFANSRNGGILVIGKKEESGKFNLVGVTEEQAATFDTTKVAQWVNNRFSPPIRLVCYRQEVDGKLLVVIEVLEFDDVPAICTKSFQCPKTKDTLLREKTIYVRTANAASAPVGTVEELRTLIGLATKKRHDEMVAFLDAMLRGRPLVPPPTDDKQFEDELARLEAEVDSSEKKVGQGEWFFAFHPAKYDVARWTERDYLEGLIRKYCFRIVEEFPPCYKGTHGREWGVANNFYGEPWALTRAGLFVSRRPFREDRLEPIHARLYVPTYNTSELVLGPGEWIEYRWSLRAICEAFYFMWRMAEVYDLEETVEYQLRAGPLAGRRLVIYQEGTRVFEIPNLYGAADPCQASAFSWKASLPIGDLRADWKRPCVTTMKEFLELFPGHAVSREELEQWIEGFLTRDTGWQWHRVT